VAVVVVSLAGRLVLAVQAVAVLEPITIRQVALVA